MYVDSSIKMYSWQFLEIQRLTLNNQHRMLLLAQNTARLYPLCLVVDRGI